MKDMQQTEFLWFGTNRRSNIAKVNKSHPLDLPILEISKKFIPNIVLHWLFKVSNNNVMELLGLGSRCCPILNFCVQMAQNHLEIAYKAYQTVQLVSFLEQSHSCHPLLLRKIYGHQCFRIAMRILVIYEANAPFCKNLGKIHAKVLQMRISTPFRKTSGKLLTNLVEHQLQILSDT